MEMLYIGKNTAYLLLNSGELRAFKIGKVWKIPKDSVSEYIINKTKNHTDVLGGIGMGLNFLLCYLPKRTIYDIIINNGN